MGYAVLKEVMEIPKTKTVGQQRQKQKRSYRMLRSFLIVSISTTLFVLYLGLGAYLYSALDIPLPRIAQKILAILPAQSFAADYNGPVVLGGTRTDKVWNCNGIYTNSPTGINICVKVDTVDTSDLSGTRYFTEPWEN
ncbi:hypothetical protein OAO01_09465 [Oligoflexia bacterium]|nr:hypothetical protein [Oligoflexia bacterium]